MRIELISTSELGPAERREWRRLQGRERTISTPALSPYWARCVGAARADARVAVIEDGGGRAQAFLPVQVGRAGVIEPLAASLGLGCGLVGDPGLEWGAAEWLRDLRARALPFAGAPQRQVELARFARGEALRLSAELYGGASAYVRRRRRDQVDVLGRRARRMEALADARGAPRIRLFACDRPDFDRVLAWSAAARRSPRSGWEAAALRLAFERDPEDGFYGAFFTMRLGGALAAGVLFLVDHRQAQLVLYGEDPRLEPHEPAAVLAADALMALAARGVVEADLGAVDGPIVRELATRPRRELYGLVRPAARPRRRGFAAPLIALGRRQASGARVAPH